MKILCIIFFILPLFVFADDKLSSFPTDEKYYTVQINSFPWKERDKAVELYELLKKKNYLVYHKHKYINGNSYARVRVEIFKNLSDAKLFAEEFKEKEGIDYFIDVADVIVEDFNNQFLIITTPQAIIYKTKNNFYELCKGSQTEISPDGKQIVFVGRQGISILNIETKKIKVIKKFDFDSDDARSLEPKWSPDGKYIAYLVKNNWELHTELWVINSDGTNNICFIPYDKKKQLKVKYHLWHPKTNKIFYSFGQTFGTITVGGNIYLADLGGAAELFIKSNTKNREEIYKEFRIVDELLYFKVAHFDESFNQREYILNKKFIGNIK